MACMIPPEEIYPRRILGLIVATIGVFMYFYIGMAIEYETSFQKMKFVEWDLANITAADYTVEFDLTKT